MLNTTLYRVNALPSQWRLLESQHSEQGRTTRAEAFNVLSACCISLVLLLLKDGDIMATISSDWKKGQSRGCLEARPVKPVSL